MRAFLVCLVVLPLLAFVMAPDLANRLRIKIRRLMEDRSLTQADLARALQVSRPRISQILKSARELQATLTLDRLERLADAFGLPVTALLLPDDEAQEALSRDEKSLVDLYRLLPTTQRDSLLGLLHFVFEPRRSANAERRALALVRQNLTRQTEELAERRKRERG